jgi:hypothetical protein
MVQVLTHNQPIRSASWYDSTFARVWTLAGDCAKYGVDYDAALEREQARNHAIVGTIYAGATLSGDASRFAALAEAKRVAASAAVVASGDLVSIDGVTYRVQFAMYNENRKSPMNSDPIHFEAV